MSSRTAARGDMENRLKEQQLGLLADCTRAATMHANQLRLYFASFAHVLLCGLRRLGPKGTQFARARCTTIRVKLLKIGARRRITVRRAARCRHCYAQKDDQTRKITAVTSRSRPLTANSSQTDPIESKK